MMKTTFAKPMLTIFLLGFLMQLAAQAPAGYYTSAEGKMAAALKSQLASIVSSGAVDVGYDGLYNVYKTSDVLPSGKIWDMYSLKSNGTANYYFTSGSAECGSYNSEGDCYNREHTFCDSWLGQASPQRSDAHHIIPTDGYVNNRRSSFPHGKVGSASWTSSNGSKLGSSDASTGYSGTVFEPIDEFKGDFARMYFYVATRYESKIAGWVGNGSAGEILAGNSYPAYKTWFLNLMLQWNASDPVSPKEIQRNNAVATYQKNRNPYIDYPELAEYIWGNKKDQAWYIGAGTSPALTMPANGSSVDFGKVTYQQTASSSLQIKAANLTGNLSLALTGTNAADFSISIATLTKAQAEAGYSLTVYCSPLAVGQRSATLSISGGGISPVTVNLSASAIDSFVALAATNISQSGFTANWTLSASATDYLLNVFSYAGNGATPETLFEEDFNAGLPTGWTFSGYQDNNTAGAIRLASGSNNGSVTTPVLNLSKETSLTVRARQYGSDTGAKLTVKVNGDSLTSFVTAAANQDFKVDIPVKTATSTLTFSAAKGMRVYLDYLKLATRGTVQVPVSVAGYPLSVGNVLSYPVTGLQADSTYYFTVTPQGNQASVSDAIRVKTSAINNALRPIGLSSCYWVMRGNTLQLMQLPSGYEVELYTVQGVSAGYLSAQSSVPNIVLPQKGIYFLRIKKDGFSEIRKVLY